MNDEIKEIAMEFGADLEIFPNGEIEVTAKSTNKWIPKELIPFVVARSINLPVSWRHKIHHRQDGEPIQYPVLGYIAKSMDQDDELFNRYHLYNEHSFQKEVVSKVIKLVTKKKNKEPIGEDKLGFSIGASMLVDIDKETKKIKALYPIEYGMTPDPDCNTCYLEKNEADKMPGEEKTEHDEKEAVEVAALEARYKVLETKVAELEKEKKDAETAKTAAEKEAQSTKALVTAMQVEFEAKITAIKRAPLLEKIELAEKELGQEINWNFFKPTYETLPEEKLKERLTCLAKQLEAKKKSVPPPIVTEHSGPAVKVEKATKEKMLADEPERVRKNPGLHRAYMLVLKEQGFDVEIPTEVKEA